MNEIFNKQFFTDNRKSLVKASGAELIIITANGLIQRSADTTFPFRQDSNFWYLTGIDEPDYILVIHEAESFLISPKRAEHRDLWDGAINQELLLKNSGLSEIKEHHEGWLYLDRLLKKSKKAFTITPAEPYFEHFGFYANPARASLLELLKQHRRLELIDLRKTLARLRQVKQPEEIKAIQLAIDITADSLKRVKKNLTEFKNEREIVAELNAHFLNSGASGHAYSPIVASGINAATIHYVANSDDLANKQLLLMDVGAEVCNYSADISRTFALKPPSKRQLAVFEAVIRVRNYAMGLLKPGADMKSYEAEVDKFMGEELVALGLIKDATNKKQLKKYYPHLTSHFLGLDTHDAADYTIPLAQNMVMTVEPGIYIPEEGFGIRIEDDVIVTDKGIRNLSENLPIELG